MLALRRDKERAELLSDGEGQGSGEEPGNAAIRNSPA